MILGIDPGPTESAFAFVDDNGKIVDFRKVLNKDLRDLLQSNNLRFARLAAIEMIASYGMPVGAEVFETCVWIGIFSECLRRNNIPTVRPKRVTVKTHHCHNSTAKDGNVRQAVIDRLGPPGLKKTPGPTYGVTKDCWQAIAVALYAHDMGKQA